MSGRNHAIVFGAAGLLGWATVEQLLSNYPVEGSFDRVTAVINRPLPESDFFWPPDSSSRPDLQIVSGINLFDSSAADLTKDLGDKVDGIENITHVFYFVFKEVNEDHTRECQANCNMMQRVVDAIDVLSPRLKSFVYPGGTRGYGIYVPGGTFHAPLTESLADNLPENYAKTVAYPWFRKLLTKASEGKTWTWTEICPDAVVGFTPNGSGWSLALHWGQYLSLYAHNHGAADNSGPPVEVPFPGNEKTYNSLFTPVSSRTLGRAAVHSSLNPARCGGKVINIADSERPTTFREIWPALAAWFGLQGVGPTANEELMKPGEYVARYKHIFEEKGRPKAAIAGVGAGCSQLDSVGYWLSFDRQLSLGRLRSSGFMEERNPTDGWLGAFEKFREAGVII
ncbi:3-oxo-Delta(4,5)-steroid 5-beta-reductase [Colletotrichum chlorophyti]|uniref:3-oxo-Delta(4,5)-steroid 5-beta-reductase n=1 Tax=Colletotrichum chlorophyti TaxID=708187 RepID=A0A1Q8RY82_9PEZI|nr:3-oxo-Delta(4,5)-steroid 5-beta-reductase [Colletotrichum chlorophyti]